MPGRVMSPNRWNYPQDPLYDNRGAPQNRHLSPPAGRPLSPGLHDIYQNRPVSPEINSRGRPTSPIHYRGRRSPEIYRNMPRNGEVPLPPGPHRGNRAEYSGNNNRTRQGQYAEQVGQMDFEDDDSIPNDAHDLMNRLNSNARYRNNAFQQQPPRRGRSEERLMESDYPFLRRPRDFSPPPRWGRDLSPRPQRALSPRREREKGRRRFILERGLSPRRRNERPLSPRRDYSPPNRYHQSRPNVIDDLNNGIYGPPVPVTSTNSSNANNHHRRRDRRNAFSPPPPRHAHSVPLFNQEQHFWGPRGPQNYPIRPLPGMVRPPQGVSRPPFSPNPGVSRPSFSANPAVEPLRGIRPRQQDAGPPNAGPYNAGPRLMGPQPVFHPHGGYPGPRQGIPGPRGPFIRYPAPPGMAGPARPIGGHQNRPFLY